jgi:dolichol-phosphate mannosyltransferase
MVRGPVWIVVPTYNEAENVERMIHAILDVCGRAHIDGSVLIVDDGSPDGTGALAEAIATNNSHVHVLHRTAKEGIGPAYRAGFRYALDQGAERIVEMDCDFSHNPEALPALIAGTENADLALGSRYVTGGGTRNWGRARKIISRSGCIYAKVILRLPLNDLTGGFKCFRRVVLETIPLDAVAAAGYGFQIEMTYRAVRLGFRVVEVPIIFTERTYGVSKMSRGIVWEAATLVPRLRRRVGRQSRAPR